MWSVLAGILLKLIEMFLKGEIDVERKTTGEILEPDPAERHRIIEFLRMHYKDTSGDRPAVNASNFKRDDT